MKRNLRKLKDKGIEYLILGQHDVLDENGKRSYILSKPIDDQRVNQYVNLAIKGIKTGLFSYMAHPDVFILPLEGLTESMKKDCVRLCKMAKKYNVPLEINLSGLAKNGITKFPSLFL